MGLTLSRWHRSSYETDADLAAEVALLGRAGEVLPFEHDAEVIIVTSGRRVDSALLDRVPSARWVLTTTSGSDHLDLVELGARGVGSARLPEARRDAVVETSLWLLLEGLRRGATLRARAAAGVWARGELPALDMRMLHGHRIGVVGLGVIGRRMAEVLRFLGAEVWGSDPRGVPEGVFAAEPAEMMERCAAVSLHCSLTPSSRALVDGALLDRAHPGLVLVNTARGALVDVDRAVHALRAGSLAALGLDVFASEPYPHLARDAGVPGLTLLPHAAGFHAGLNQAVREGLHRAVQAIAAGQEPPHRLGEGGPR